jgi:hypothetical protein
MHTVAKLGGQNFQPRSEVMLFVEKKVPSNTFSAFHDLVTLLESLTGPYSTWKDVLAEWYQSNKVGITEPEASHVAPFKLTLPTMFGNIKEGTPSSSKCFLPAIMTFNNWNSFSNIWGVKTYIMNGLDDLKVQIQQDIYNIFPDDSDYEARLLAQDMHTNSQAFAAEMCGWMDTLYQELRSTSEATEDEDTNSQAFAAEMCGWMDTLYQELRSTSEATEDEAWELVSACIKKIFEELRQARAPAANATSDDNKIRRCATYLWALFQAHKVQREILDARFRNHPSIAPVIVLHVLKTRVTRVAHTNAVKRLEGRMTALDIKDTKSANNRKREGGVPKREEAKNK